MVTNLDDVWKMFGVIVYTLIIEYVVVQVIDGLATFQAVRDRQKCIYRKTNCCT